MPSNIAEGYGRGTRKEYLQFLFIAQGSLKELETQAILAGRLSHVSDEAISDMLIQTDIVGRMLGGLIRSLKAKLR